MAVKIPSVDFHQGTLRLFGWPSRQLSELAGEISLAHDPREGCVRTDAIHAPVVGRWCRSHDFAVQWRIGLGSNTPIKHDIAIADQRGITLRSDQADATDAFCGGGGRGLVVMPTGTGKTVVAMDIMLRLQKSTLVVVPVRDLMYQWHEKIRQATGIDAGLIGDGVHRVSPVSVTTYDSAAIHMPRIGDRFELLIFDEVHHLAGPWRSDAARMSIATHRLGLTATLPDHPGRLRTLNDLVGPTVYQQSIAEASGRSLANYQIHRIAVSMSAVERERYEALSKRIQTFVFEQKELDPHFAWEDTYRLSASGRDDPVRAQAANAAMRAFRQKRQIEEHATGKQRALEDLFRLHHGEPIIVFTGSNVMARKISTRFMVPCLLSHCGKRERREWLQGFADGQFPVLVANRVLDEGVDLPEVKTAIVLGGLSSSRQAIQRLGRVLRKGSGNQPAVLYEVVLNETKEVQRSRDRRRNDAYQMNRGGTDR